MPRTRCAGSFSKVCVVCQGHVTAVWINSSWNWSYNISITSDWQQSSLNVTSLRFLTFLLLQLLYIGLECALLMLRKIKLSSVSFNRSHSFTLGKILCCLHLSLNTSRWSSVEPCSTWLQTLPCKDAGKETTHGDLPLVAVWTWLSNLKAYYMNKISHLNAHNTFNLFKHLETILLCMVRYK